MSGRVVGTIFIARAFVVRKWLVAPESRMAQRLMVAASVLMVFKRAVATRADQVDVMGFVTQAASRA